MKELSKVDAQLSILVAERDKLKIRRDELERKSQIKSDEQLKVEALLTSEEKLKSIINERDLTISQQEKIINDLKLKLQVFISLIENKQTILKRKKVALN